MKKIFKKSNALKLCFALFFCLFKTTIFAQVKPAPPVTEHRLFAGVGYGYNSIFNGFTTNIGYEYHFDKNFLSLAYNQLTDFQIGGENPPRIYEWGLLYNYEIAARKINFSAGAGLAATTLVVGVRDLVELPPAESYFGVEQSRKSVLGFPVNVRISGNTKRKLTGGFGLHANFNSLATLADINLFLSYRL